MSSRYLERLKSEILPYSRADVWDLATKEWEVVRMFDDETCTTECVCGKERLRRVYEITNVFTDHAIQPVGSVCIQHFENDEMVEQMKVLRRQRRETLKYGDIVFSHSRWKGRTIAFISTQEDFMDFVIHKRVESKFHHERNEDYQKLIAFYNLKKCDTK